MIAKKRGNLENPALSYLTNASVTLDSKTASRTSSGYASTNVNTEVAAIGENARPARIASAARTNYKEMLKQVEARSKRLQCLIQPSLFDKVKAIADRRGVSFNDIVHTTLEELAENEGH